MDAFGIRIKEYILLMNMVIVKNFIRLKIIIMEFLKLMIIMIIIKGLIIIYYYYNSCLLFIEIIYSVFTF